MYVLSLMYVYPFKSCIFFSYSSFPFPELFPIVKSFTFHSFIFEKGWEKDGNITIINFDS